MDENIPTPMLVIIHVSRNEGELNFDIVQFLRDAREEKSACFRGNSTARQRHSTFEVLRDKNAFFANSKW